MQKKYQELTPNEKLDYLYTEIREVRKIIDPPWWKRLFRWGGNNFFTLMTLVIVLISLYKVYIMVAEVQQKINTVESSYENLEKSVKQGFEKIKLW